MFYGIYKKTTTKSQNKWNNIFKALKEKNNCLPRFLYPVKIYFKNKGNLKTFLELENLK